MQQPVSWETWQKDLNFDNLRGNGRSSAGANERKHYDNYVRVFGASDAATQNSINAQHGFSGGGGGGGGHSEAREEISSSEFEGRIDDAASATREEITPEASGLEDTVIDRKSYSPDDEKREITNNATPSSPLTIVVDVSTGVEYSSPTEARRAGVVTWKYKESGV